MTETSDMNNRGLSVPLRVAACVLSAIGALVFNAFPLFLGALAEQFDLGDEQMGLLGSSYLGGFALVSFCALWWLGRLRVRYLAMIAYGVILSSLLAFLLVSSQHLSYAMACLGGGCVVLFIIGLELLAHDRDPDRAFGLKLCAEMLLAGVVMYVMTGYVLSQFGYRGFVFGCLILFAATAVFIWPLPNKRLVASTATNGGESGAAVWMAALALFLRFAVFSALWGFMERIGQVMAGESEALGAILSLSILAGLLGALLGAAVGSRFGHTKPLMLCFALLLLCLLAMQLWTGLGLFVTVACLINALLQLCVIYQMGLVVACDSSGKFTVFIAFILAAGGAVGPGVAGSLIEASGFSALYGLLAAVTLISAALTLLASGHKKKRYTAAADCLN